VLRLADRIPGFERTKTTIATLAGCSPAEGHGALRRLEARGLVEAVIKPGEHRTCWRRTGDGDLVLEGVISYEI
jgi:hypothetical protein